MKVYDCKTDCSGFLFSEAEEVKESLENIEDHPIDESAWQVDNFPY